MLTAHEITPKVCIVCKKYTGDGNLCDDPQCKKIMESQFNMIFDQLHRRTAAAKHLTEILQDGIISLDINAKILKPDYNKNVKIQCNDDKAVNIITKSIKDQSPERNIHTTIENEHTLINVYF